MITLTNEDADFIANIARNELKEFKEAYESQLKEINEMKSLADELAHKISGTDDEKYKKIVETYPVVIENAAKCFNDRKQKYERVIELMMVGSNE